MITLLQRFFIIAAFIIFFGKLAFADTAFRNLSQSDFDNIVREYSANANLHNVTAASSMGTIFGFEVGLTAGATATPKMNDLVKEATSSSEGVSYFPHAGLLGVVSVPFGLTGELNLTPKINVKGDSYSAYSMALKWTFTDAFFPMLPVNLAVRGFFSKSKLKYSQTVNVSSTPGTSDVKYDGNVGGIQFLVSPRLLPVIEPYAGIGFIKGKGDINITGATATDFFNFTSAQSASSKMKTTEFLLGINANFALIDLGLEYSRAFDTNSLTGKFAFRF